MDGKEKDYNEGQKDGSQATIFDEIVEALNPLTSPEYRAGFRHGVANKPRDKDDDKKQ